MSNKIRIEVCILVLEQATQNSKTQWVLAFNFQAR